MDKDCIPQLIALGSNTTSIQHIQDLAAKEMQKAGLDARLALEIACRRHNLNLDSMAATAECLGEPI